MKRYPRHRFHREMAAWAPQDPADAGMFAPLIEGLRQNIGWFLLGAGVGIVLVAIAIAAVV